MIKGDIVITTADVGLRYADARMRTNQHGYEFLKKGGGTRSDMCTISRTIPAWNRLNADVFNADSLDSFKSRLGALCP